MSRKAGPFSRPTLTDALSATEQDIADFFASLSLDELRTRVGTAWTPAEHLAHLNTAVSAVARGLRLPRLLLRLRFGRARTPSRSYVHLRDDYRARLASGGRASGRFIPPTAELSASEAATHRDALLARWSRVNARLRTALEGWNETELDRIRLPHPILGMITAREMVFFTIYHGGHHIAAASRRISRLAP